MVRRRWWRKNDETGGGNDRGLGEGTHEWLGFWSRTGVLSHPIAPQGNTQSLPVGGDILHDLKASPTE
jgi:hypothetical protein